MNVHFRCSSFFDKKNLTKLIKPTIEIKYQDGKLYAYIITFAAFNFQREER